MYEIVLDARDADLLLKENVAPPGCTFHQDRLLPLVSFLLMAWARLVNCAWMPMPRVLQRPDWRPSSSIIGILGRAKESRVAVRGFDAIQVSPR